LGVTERKRREKSNEGVLLIRSRPQLVMRGSHPAFPETTTTEAEAQIQVAARATHAGAPVMPTLTRLGP